MTGFVKFGDGFAVPTQPELWRDCKSEEQYFNILRIRQQKKKDEPGKILLKPDDHIPDSEPGAVPF